MSNLELYQTQGITIRESDIPENKTKLVRSLFYTVEHQGWESVRGTVTCALDIAKIPYTLIASEDGK